MVGEVAGVRGGALVGFFCWYGCRYSWYWRVLGVVA